MSNTKNSDYRTIGAISGHFPRRVKAAKALSPAESERIAIALTNAASGGLSPDATNDYVIAQMSAYHPTTPWSMISREMDRIRS